MKERQCARGSGRCVRDARAAHSAPALAAQRSASRTYALAGGALGAAHDADRLHNNGARRDVSVVASSIVRRRDSAAYLCAGERELQHHQNVADRGASPHPVVVARRDREHDCFPLDAAPAAVAPAACALFKGTVAEGQSDLLENAPSLDGHGGGVRAAPREGGLRSVRRLLHRGEHVGGDDEPATEGGRARRGE